MQPLLPDDPSRIGPFRIEARLGAGGMGRVYLGRDEAGTEAAVKVIHAGLAADPWFRSRFAREVSIAQRVRAAWTAPVLAADADGDPPWLATEFIAGPGLDDVVRESGRLPAAALELLAHRLAVALASLHADAVVHRDLKPSNVLMAEDGPRLIDFGIARALDSTRITHTGTVFGTPAFMSPEQAMGDEAGPPSDVFSFASVVTYAANGVGPFGQTATPVAILRRVIDDEPDLVDVPDPLRHHLAGCLAKDPADRPTAAALAGRLDPDAVTEHAQTVPELRSGGTHVLQDPPRRRPRLMTVVNLGLAVILLVTGGIAMSRVPDAGDPIAAHQPEARAVADILRLPEMPYRLRLSPDGRRLYVCGYSDIAVFDTATRAAVGTLRLPTRSRPDITFGPDGSRGYVPLSGGGLAVVETSSLSQVATIPTDPVEVAVAAPDGRAIYALGEDALVSVIDPISGAVISRIPVAAESTELALAPDGSRLYASGYQAGAVSVIDTAAGTVLATVPATNVQAVEPAPDGSQLYVQSSGAIAVLDASSMMQRGALGPEGASSALAVLPDGRLVVGMTGKSRADSLGVIDPTTFLIRARLSAGEHVSMVAVAPDGATAYAAGGPGDPLRIIDLTGAR
jgi:YVTN family beta-propeller protein